MLRKKSNIFHIQFVSFDSFDLSFFKWNMANSSG